MSADATNEPRADVQLDLRGTACPMNWVKMKLRLEEMDDGQVAEVLLDDGDAIRNVPNSAKAEGHAILRVTPLEGAGAAEITGFRVWIKKAGGQAER